MTRLIAAISGILLALNSTAGFSQSEPTPVSVYYPKEEVLNATIDLSGNIVAKQDAQLAPLESGLVNAIFVDAGDKVQAGQKLLSLDSKIAKLQLAQVKANLKAANVQLTEARRQLDEVVSLAKRKVVADSLLAERKAALANAEAGLANAKAQMSLQQEVVNRHVLTAPFDGVIARRNVDVGEWVSQQSQILQLVSDKSLRLVADLPQEHLLALKENEEIRVIVVPDVIQNMKLELALSKIVTVSEPLSRTVQIRIDLPDKKELIPGMSARVRIELFSEAEGFTWIPASALKRHPDGGKSVFVVEGDRVKRIKVKHLRTRSNQIAVTGLPSKSAVVITGAELLRDNQLVKISKTEGDH